MTQLVDPVNGVLVDVSPEKAERLLANGWLSPKPPVRKSVSKK